MNKIKILSIALVMTLAFSLSALAQNTLKRVDYKELETMIEKGNVTVVDVRDINTYNQGHIEGAVNIPNTNPASAYEAKLTKDDKIVLVCYGGVSSQRVGKMLMEAGFTDITDMIGGMRAWRGKRVR